tara:strand:+ start:4629 stop:4817 length:189 start_codon:yes stop_codon:yes gene_type:complete
MPTNSYVNLRDLIEKEKPKPKITLKQIFHNISSKMCPKNKGKKCTCHLKDKTTFKKSYNKNN